MPMQSFDRSNASGNGTGSGSGSGSGTRQSASALRAPLPTASMGRPNPSRGGEVHGSHRLSYSFVEFMEASRVPGSRKPTDFALREEHQHNRGTGTGGGGGTPVLPPGVKPYHIPIQRPVPNSEMDGDSDLELDFDIVASPRGTHPSYIDDDGKTEYLGAELYPDVKSDDSGDDTFNQDAVGHRTTGNNSGRRRPSAPNDEHVVVDDNNNNPLTRPDDPNQRRSSSVIDIVSSLSSIRDRQHTISFELAGDAQVLPPSVPRDREREREREREGRGDRRREGASR